MFENISEFKKQLDLSESADRIITGKLSVVLYESLVAPVLKKVSDKKRWLIIPYNQLCYIPFEALSPPGDHPPILYRHAVSYNYSANFLSPENNTTQSYRVLAIAPFASSGNIAGLQPLAYSKEEVEGLNGKILMDKEATKKIFFLLTTFIR